jgi:hypothetical protein
MHARIEQLLSIRDGDPVDAGIAAHVGQCAACTEQLRNLALVREQMRSLPQLEPPGSSWDRIQSRLAEARPASRGWSGLRAHAMAASAVVGIGLVVVASFLVRHGGPSHQVAPQVALAPSQGGGNADDAKHVADLVAQSQRLDDLLQALPERPRIERVSTVATIDTIEERVQWLDVQLSQTPDTRLSDAQARRLWRERVDLMDSLVKVRYAEADRASF